MIVDLSGARSRTESLVRGVRLRSNGGLPIVVLSAHSAKADVGAILDLGVDAHVTKPISADELVSVVVGALSFTSV